MSKHERTRTDQRILNVVSAMPFPFGALQEVHARAEAMRAGEEVTLEAVADYLETLCEAVACYVRQYDQDRSELLQLKADVAGARRLLGL